MCSLITAHVRSHWYMIPWSIAYPRWLHLLTDARSFDQMHILADFTSFSSVSLGLFMPSPMASACGAMILCSLVCCKLLVSFLCCYLIELSLHYLSINRTLLVIVTLSTLRFMHQPTATNDRSLAITSSIAICPPSADRPTLCKTVNFFVWLLRLKFDKGWHFRL